MKFNRMGEWFELSDCGAYTVAASRVMDEFKFQSFKLAPRKGVTAELLGTFSTADEARNCCRLHRDPQQETAA